MLATVASDIEKAGMRASMADGKLGCLMDDQGTNRNPKVAWREEGSSASPGVEDDLGSPATTSSSDEDEAAAADELSVSANTLSHSSKTSRVSN